MKYSLLERVISYAIAYSIIAIFLFGSIGLAVMVIKWVIGIIGGII